MISKNKILYFTFNICQFAGVSAFNVIRWICRCIFISYFREHRIIQASYSYLEANMQLAADATFSFIFHQNCNTA